tara:strand:+ start:804 stop:1037 length:234 start_codon:yes stop_codon:yes gene_type:complete
LTKVAKVLDLKSIPCPLNLVKCKLALEKLSSNESLIVSLDKGEPEVMVKKTLHEKGYCLKIIEENEKTIKFKIFYEN